jgi:hypothetical protein
LHTTTCVYNTEYMPESVVLMKDQHAVAHVDIGPTASWSSSVGTEYKSFYYYSRIEMDVIHTKKVISLTYQSDIWMDVASI